jgi:SAM-dependent methyltransferase
MTLDPRHDKADPKRFYTARDQAELIGRYDEAAGVYEEAMSTDVGWTGHVELAAVIARHVPKDDRLLDAGAGTGMLGGLLSQRGYANMEANDLSPGMLEMARAKGIYRDCRVMELGKHLDYPDGAFDAAAVCGVFTPNHAPAAALDELVRIVRTGGLVLYTLRSDETPAGFAEKHTALERAGAWELVEAGAPFPSIASEPHIRHRCWVWRVL